MSRLRLLPPASRGGCSITEPAADLTLRQAFCDHTITWESRTPTGAPPVGKGPLRIVTEMTIEEVRARYQAERAKRIRPDGNAQFRPLAGDFADFDTDPWVEPGFTRDPVVDETTAVIVGGGFCRHC